MLLQLIVLQWVVAMISRDGVPKRESEADDGERAGRVRAVMTRSWGVGGAGEPLSEDV